PFAHGGSRLYEFDRTGRFVREIGQDSYGFLFAQQVRVDPQDNIWVVDQMSNMVMKFDPNGRVQMLLGRKSESERVPAPPPGTPGRAGRGPAGAGAQSDIFQRPSDVAWDGAGNIYVADGYGNARVAKFDKNGKFIRSWGQKGTAEGQFNSVRGIAIDASGNVYVADAGNKRIQVFDGDGTFKSQIGNIGTPSAICISPGPHQYLYSSNSNPPDDIDHGGEIYKLELDGKVIGIFGKAGKLPKEFGTVNAIDCRRENELLVAEIGNWRVQKVTLRAK
ncbi:MAG TPA: peptidyl-alpha-hydroxyglycine alpha-amidating lyase family protein, partial [Bryobacteraceae bacterium]|nr:peptidyl-alpha-hydroxyglycine alpha-amidating lyase family protein [Bryobacteraceae bacterium]